MTALIFWIVIIFLYFLPAFVAVHRKKKNADSISLLNLLAGWTVVGWIVAMVWSVAKD